MLVNKKSILESLNELDFQKKLDWISGRWCGGFDNHGISYSRELDHDRGHDIDNNGFHEISSIVICLMIFR
jgi:hypothetical protein